MFELALKLSLILQGSQIDPDLKLIIEHRPELSVELWQTIVIMVELT